MSFSAIARALAVALLASAMPAHAAHAAPDAHAAPGAEPAGAPVVDVTGGRISGARRSDAIIFKGIPYAAPPVGEGRWRAPAPVQPWPGVRAADRFGNICMQPPKAADDTGVGLEPESEDCLTLNVFRPAGAAHRLPVMVWIHGGGLVTGSSSAPLYDGGRFVAHGVVLVSINYRLGALGFFAHPAIDGQGGALGNYGLMDQIAALHWVQDNIARFGGDPAKVTIFGESAGAASVEALMTSPLAHGLFARAVAQSGYGRGAYRRMSATSPDGKPAAQQDGIAFARTMGLGDNATAAGLRALSAKAIVDKVRYDQNFNFILDNATLTEDLWPAFRNRHEAPVPFLLGSNGLEFDPRMAPGDWLKAYLSDAEKTGLTAPYGGAAQRDQHLPTDVIFTGQARALARLHTRNGYKSWVYRFTALPASKVGVWRGLPHAAERQSVFDQLGTSIWGVDDKDRALARQANAYWSRFAIHGDPNGPGLPQWPAYHGNVVMDFTREGPVAAPDPWAARLDALAAILDPRS